MPVKELKLDFYPEIKNLEVYSKRTALSRYLEGNWATTFKGRGVEFEGYRAYMYGDDASMIDWGASLRARQALVKEFELMRSYNIYFLLDVSNSMLFSSTDKLKAEYAAELVFSMSYASIQANDAVGLGMYTDKLLVNIYPELGVGVHKRLVRALGNPQNYGGPSNFKRVISYVNSVLPRRAVLIIVSDFIGLGEGWQRYLNLIAQKFDVIGVMVRDPRDRELPRGVGQYTLQDPYSEQKYSVNVNQYAKMYKEYVQKEESQIRTSFEKAKSSLLVLSTDQEYFTRVTKFFRKRLSFIERF
jgi:uncharacterized protein (DUF58 family)